MAEISVWLHNFVIINIIICQESGEGPYSALISCFSKEQRESHTPQENCGISHTQLNCRSGEIEEVKHAYKRRNQRNNNRADSEGNMSFFVIVAVVNVYLF